MARKKRQRFEALKELPNVFDRDEAGPGGDWIRHHFGNAHPLILELGCGKGEYTLSLARRHPGHNVLGVDRRGDRIWRGASKAVREGLPNAAFLRADIRDLELYVDEGQVEAIWLPYPDPRPKRRQAKHRTIAPDFLAIYRRLVRPGGRIHVKTDDPFLYQCLQESIGLCGAHILEMSDDLYAHFDGAGIRGVTTTFEQRHLAEGRKIRYLAFSFERDS